MSAKELLFGYMERTIRNGEEDMMTWIGEERDEYEETKGSGDCKRGV